MCDNQQPSEAKYLTVKLTYFKPRGKYYGEGEFTVDAAQPLFKIWETIAKRLKDTTPPGLIKGPPLYLPLFMAQEPIEELPLLLKTSCFCKSLTK